MRRIDRRTSSSGPNPPRRRSKLDGAVATPAPRSFEFSRANGGSGTRWSVAFWLMCGAPAPFRCGKSTGKVQVDFLAPTREIPGDRGLGSLIHVD
jgi:hypothetical protein